MNNPRHQMNLTPAAFLRASLAIASVLVLLHMIGLFLRHGLGINNAAGLFPLFDLNSEQNAPTLYSSILLLGGGALCFGAGRIVTGWRWHWWFMALIFLVLGIDETYGLHERVFFVLRGHETPGTAQLAARLHGLRWSNLLPWLLAIGMIVVVWFWSFVRHVGPRVSITAAVSAFVYLLGAVGFDALTHVESVDGLAPSLIVALTMFEEVFELVGACLFNYSILRYLVEKSHLTIDLVP